jgi:periplasmic protein TonB
MFEDALMESSGRLWTHWGRFSGLAAICNSFVLCLLVLLPLLHPASLPKQTFSMVLAPPAPPAPPLVHMTRAVSAAGRAAVLSNPFTAPSVIPDHIESTEHEPLPAAQELISLGKGVGGSLNGLPDFIGAAGVPRVNVVPPRKLAISCGVIQGRKLSGTDPRYPAIAIAAHVQGTIVLAAIISRTGAIENLRLVSGPLMLAPAAEDAVRTWRYRPYLLNGEPVEVETTVNVVFHLGD